MNAEEIILMKMADIVFVDKRPFCYTDFLSFEYDGEEYKFKHGTIRNIFSKLREKGDIEYEYRSGPTFYTLPCIKFRKPMTVNHTEGINHSSNAVGTHLIKTKDLPPMPSVKSRWTSLQSMTSV